MGSWCGSYVQKQSAEYPPNHDDHQSNCHGSSQQNKKQQNNGSTNCICPICVQPYNVNGKAPMMLTNCGHTICSQCCKSLQACPFCRASIAQLQKNFAIIQMMSNLPKQQQIKPPKNVFSSRPSPTNFKQINKPSTNSQCPNGCNRPFKSSQQQVCGICKCARPVSYCTECKFPICYQCRKNIQNDRRMGCPNQCNSSLQFSSQQLCEICIRYRPVSICSKCDFRFCYNCRIKQRKLNVKCPNKCNKPFLSRSQSLNCGVCRITRPVSYCSECKFNICYSCRTKANSNKTMGCPNQCKGNLQFSSSQQKCGICKLTRPVSVCSKCKFTICFQCQIKNPKKISQNCPNHCNSSFKFKQQKTCGICRLTRPASVCRQCGFSMCYDCRIQ